MTFLKNKKFKAGFSLIELLVAMSIIILLSTLMIVNTRSSEKRRNLTMEAQKLVADLRQSQNKSMSGSGVYQSGYKGYGVYVNSAQNDRYILYGEPLNPTDDYSRNGNETTIETKQFSRARIRSVSTSGSAGILFLSPDPITYINGATGGSVTIVIESTEDSSLSATIDVNGAGLISVN